MGYIDDHRLLISCQDTGKSYSVC